MELSSDKNNIEIISNNNTTTIGNKRTVCKISILTYRSNASPSVTTALPSSQYQHSSQHRNVYLHSSTSKTGNYYGPICSSPSINQQRMITSHYQNRSSPYTIHLPRTFRCQINIASVDVGTQSHVIEDGNIESDQFITIHKIRNWNQWRSTIALRQTATIH
ncbi:unnamed protein product [Rotaria sordida]|uniref:Uncharacterized protein n=2 Tax=Rotaria sordida TaxID=392033 RepID=A0A814B5H9_9BILA|nr:unnamed protein product [Rotaria sordida]